MIILCHKTTFSPGHTPRPVTPPPTQSTQLQSIQSPPPTTTTSVLPQTNSSLRSMQQELEQDPTTIHAQLGVLRKRKRYIQSNNLYTIIHTLPRVLYTAVTILNHHQWQLDLQHPVVDRLQTRLFPLSLLTWISIIGIILMENLSLLRKYGKRDCTTILDCNLCVFMYDSMQYVFCASVLGRGERY